ncbi:MAG: extracellular solute-binding protein [Lachnospiraceae bacterium]|nr:extracellular solute-binding protein [Lachnospiraceae bacterium]
MKKQLATLLIAALCLTGCGASDSSSTASESSSGDSQTTQETSTSTETVEEAGELNLYGFDEPVTIKVGISRAADFNYQGDDTASNNVWMDLYRENNIIPEILYEVDSSQADTKLSTAIMSGDYPDILAPGTSDYVNYAETGVIADITEAFEMYASDELKEYLQADGGLALESVTIDGRLYGIPEVQNPYDSVPLMFIRQDWLDNLGLQVPTTMEELVEVARAFTFDDLDGNGVNDTYGLALDGVDVLTNSVGDMSAIFAGFGAYTGTGMTFIEGEDGNVTWGGTNAEGMKAALTMLQSMYEEGTVASDFITMDSNSLFEEAGGGRCGIWFGPMWGAMVPASNIIQSDPDAHITSAPVPDGLDQGGSKALLSTSVSTVYCVSSQCENPEVLIKLLNLSVQKLCYPVDNDEFFTYYGGAGRTGWKTCLTPTLTPLKNYDNYQKESAALASGDTSELNAEQTSDYENMAAFLEMYESGDFDATDAVFSSGIALYTVFGDPEGSYAALDQMIKNDEFVYSAYNTLPTESMSENSATLKKMTVETIVKIITGDSVDTYDEFLESWYALGGQECIDDAQAWVDANN